MSFDAIAERLKQRGWKKGSRGNALGPNCLMGANVYLPQGQTVSSFRAGILPVIIEQFPERKDEDGYYSVVAFNDHADTTLDDVLMVLDKAQRKVDEAV